MSAAKWRIFVRNKDGVLEADDTADNEQDARAQASGWTGQRGQLRWVARVLNPAGQHVATYRRGVEKPCPPLTGRR